MLRAWPNAFDARVYLLQVISLTHEYEAIRGVADESLTALEYSQDAARQITASRQTRAEEYLDAMMARLKRNGSTGGDVGKARPDLGQHHDFCRGNRYRLDRDEHPRTGRSPALYAW